MSGAGEAPTSQSPRTGSRDIRRARRSGIDVRVSRGSGFGWLWFLCPIFDFHTPLNRPNHPSKVGYDEFFRIEFSDILTGSGNTV